MPTFVAIFSSERLGLVRLLALSIDTRLSEAAMNDEFSGWMLILSSALVIRTVAS